jgi:hypothetical protein
MTVINPMATEILFEERVAERIHCPQGHKEKYFLSEAFGVHGGGMGLIIIDPLLEGFIPARTDRATIDRATINRSAIIQSPLRGLIPLQGLCPGGAS